MNIINAKDIQHPHFDGTDIRHARYGQNYTARQTQRPNADC